MCSKVKIVLIISRTCLDNVLIHCSLELAVLLKTRELAASSTWTHPSHQNGVAGEKMRPCPGLIGFGKRTEGFSDGGIIGDKSGTVVGHTEETANFMSGGRGTGIVDGRDFLGVWGETISGEYIPKELDAGFVELALFGIQH